MRFLFVREPVLQLGSLLKSRVGCQQLCENIRRGVRVTFVLPETFTEGDSDFLSACDAPATAGFKILVHAVLSTEPFALAGVAGEGIQFGRCVLGDVHDEIHRLATAKVIGAFDGIDKVEPWNC
jgi:hypothetical protein